MFSRHYSADHQRMQNTFGDWRPSAATGEAGNQPNGDANMASATKKRCNKPIEIPQNKLCGDKDLLLQRRNVLQRLFGVSSSPTTTPTKQNDIQLPQHFLDNCRVVVFGHLGLGDSDDDVDHEVLIDVEQFLIAHGGLVRRESEGRNQDVDDTRLDDVCCEGKAESSSSSSTSSNDDVEDEELDVSWEQHISWNGLVHWEQTHCSSGRAVLVTNPLELLPTLMALGGNDTAATAKKNKHIMLIAIGHYVAKIEHILLKIDEKGLYPNLANETLQRGKNEGHVSPLSPFFKSKMLSGYTHAAGIEFHQQQQEQSANATIDADDAHFFARVLCEAEHVIGSFWCLGCRVATAKFHKDQNFSRTTFQRQLRSEKQITSTNSDDETKGSPFDCLGRRDITTCLRSEVSVRNIITESSYIAAICRHMHLMGLEEQAAQKKNSATTQQGNATRVPKGRKRPLWIKAEMQMTVPLLLDEITGATENVGCDDLTFVQNTGAYATPSRLAEHHRQLLAKNGHRVFPLQIGWTWRQDAPLGGGGGFPAAVSITTSMEKEEGTINRSHITNQLDQVEPAVRRQVYHEILALVGELPPPEAAGNEEVPASNVLEDDGKTHTAKWIATNSPPTAAFNKPGNRKYHVCLGSLNPVGSQRQTNAGQHDGGFRPNAHAPFPRSIPTAQAVEEARKQSVHPELFDHCVATMLPEPL